jgi:hypothetical protein
MNYKELLNSQKELVTALKGDPTSDFHKVVATTLESGIGGYMMVWQAGPTLEALSPDLLEKLVKSFPKAKREEMLLALQGKDSCHYGDRKWFLDRNLVQPTPELFPSLYKIVRENTTGP